MYFEFDNLSQALVGLSKSLESVGIWTRRGTNPAGNTCLEFPEAVLIKISNPRNRYVFVPERKWNKTLGWIESLWIARGDNSLEMPSAYVKNLLSFSDDGETMRAGYGPRIRNYGAHFVTSFYKNESYKMYNQYDSRCVDAVKTTDQLRFIVDKFKQDITTREAVITIHDPIADDFNNGEVLVTKDTPCTRSIHFMVVDGKMNCYVDMRSNDCFTYETKIPLLNGEVWEIGRLAEEKANEQFWVYSRNEKGEIVAGLAHHPRKMRKVSEIMEVKLDNGEIIRCTLDHRFMLKDGTYQKIQDIPIGTSLAPLYRKHNEKGYELCLSDNKWIPTHKLSFQSVKGSKKDSMGCLHHIDFNKHNNIPENLVEMSWDEHIALHQALVGVLNSHLWNPDDDRYNEFESQRKSILDGLNRGNTNRWTVGDVQAQKDLQASVMKAVNDYLWNHREGFRDYIREIQAENGSKNLLKLWQTEEFRNNVATIARNRMNDPDVKKYLAELTSERNRKNWQDSGYRTKMCKLLKRSWTDERCEKQKSVMSARSKSMWGKPEFVEHQRKIQKMNTSKAWEDSKYRTQQAESRAKVKTHKVVQTMKAIEQDNRVIDDVTFDEYRVRLFGSKAPSMKYIRKQYGNLETAKAELLGNHKIVSKRIIKEEVDVYDITVEKYHNFALESGVFVHNCFWGFSAVNVFNFTLMQEYVAAMVGVPVGVYFHKVDNLHIYEGSFPMLQSIIAANESSRSVDMWSDWYRFQECREWLGYKHTFTTLEEFDALINLLSAFERDVRGADDLPYSNEEALAEIEAKFGNEPMFSDWAKVIYRKWSKDTSVTFDNPYLTELFVKKLL